MPCLLKLIRALAYTLTPKTETGFDFASFSSFADAFSSISAVLYFPYTVSLMSAFEVYGMSIPIFTPSLELAVSLDMNNGGMAQRAGREELPDGRAPPASPPPSDHSVEATRYWLNLSDFMQLPHVRHFSDHADLFRQVCSADFDSISARMSDTNAVLMDEALAFWRGRLLGDR